MVCMTHTLVPQPSRDDGATRSIRRPVPEVASPGAPYGVRMAGRRLILALAVAAAVLVGCADTEGRESLPPSAAPDPTPTRSASSPPPKPLVVVAHATRPQLDLTRAEARRLTSGRVTRWQGMRVISGLPARAAIAAVEKDRRTLAVVPPRAVGPTVVAARVGGVDPIRDHPGARDLIVVGDVMLSRESRTRPRRWRRCQGCCVAPTSRSATWRARCPPEASRPRAATRSVAALRCSGRCVALGSTRCRWRTTTPATTANRHWSTPSARWRAARSSRSARTGTRRRLPARRSSSAVECGSGSSASMRSARRLRQARRARGALRPDAAAHRAAGAGRPRSRAARRTPDRPAGRRRRRAAALGDAVHPRARTDPAPRSDGAGRCRCGPGRRWSPALGAGHRRGSAACRCCTRWATSSSTWTSWSRRWRAWCWSDVLGCGAQGGPAAALPDGPGDVRAAAGSGAPLPRGSSTTCGRPARDRTPHAEHGSAGAARPPRSGRSARSWARSTTDGDVARGVVPGVRRAAEPHPRQPRSHEGPVVAGPVVDHGLCRHSGPPGSPQQLRAHPVRVSRRCSPAPPPRPRRGPARPSREACVAAWA